MLCMLLSVMCHLFVVGLSVCWRTREFTCILQLRLAREQVYAYVQVKRIVFFAEAMEASMRRGVTQINGEPIANNACVAVLISECSSSI